MVQPALIPQLSPPSHGSQRCWPAAAGSHARTRPARPRRVMQIASYGPLHTVGALPPATAAGPAHRLLVAAVIASSVVAELARAAGQAWAGHAALGGAAGAFRARVGSLVLKCCAVAAASSARGARAASRGCLGPARRTDSLTGGHPYPARQNRYARSSYSGHPAAVLVRPRGFLASLRFSSSDSCRLSGLQSVQANRNL